MGWSATTARNGETYIRKNDNSATTSVSVPSTGQNLAPTTTWTSTTAVTTPPATGR